MQLLDDPRARNELNTCVYFCICSNLKIITVLGQSFLWSDVNKSYTYESGMLQNAKICV